MSQSSSPELSFCLFISFCPYLLPAQETGSPPCLVTASAASCPGRRTFLCQPTPQLPAPSPVGSVSSIPWEVLLALSAELIVAGCEKTYLMQPAKQCEGM